MAAGMRLAVVAACSVATSVGCSSAELRPIEGPFELGVVDAGELGEVDGGVATGREAAAESSAPTSVDGGPRCKRGIAANLPPSAAFAPAVSSPGVNWWLNWTTLGSDAGTPGSEFVPMIWGSASVNATIPAGAKYLLGFNEPNFKAQSDLTAQQAASYWPTVQAHARAAGVPLVSPSVNFCGSASNSSQCTDPNVTDPYTYLREFFSACAGCEVDFVAVHAYDCDLPSLEAYLEGNLDAGGTLQGFLQFGRPIWLSEFSCDATHSVAEQQAFMRAAVPYLENNPNVFRYAWFSATPIPNAELANSDGSLTDLGKTYVALPENCP